MLLTEDNYTCKLPKDTQEIAQKELNETNKLRKKAISDVRKWIKSQTHIRRIRLDSSFILRFLRMQKFDIKESCEILEKYLTMRGQYPSWFQNLDCRDTALSDLVDKGYIFVLPDRDQHGRRVIFSQAAAFDSSKYTVSDLMRAHVMTFETLLNDEENQVRGFTYIFDEKDVSWSHISIWTPSEVSKAFSCCERALPMRHKDIHFLNLPWTMNLIFQFAKSLLSDKIRSRFKTHSNLEHLQRGGARGGGAEEVAARQRQRVPSARRDGQREEARDAGRAGAVSPCCLVMMPHVEAGHTVSIFQSTSTRENDRFS